MTTVSEAVEQRISVRSFKPDPVPADVVQDILVRAARAPSGGNLQPWLVHAVAGEPLARIKAEAVARMEAGEHDPGDYTVYPENLWEPLRTRRFQAGEDLYAKIGIAREDKPGRLRQFANNANLFGAPVGLFFSINRKCGPPQWSDVGMYMQSVMLLAIERGLDTCSQEFWSRFPLTVARNVPIPEDHLLFSGMALGYRDDSHPLNSLRTRRDDFAVWGEMIGF